MLPNSVKSNLANAAGGLLIVACLLSTARVISRPRLPEISDSRLPESLSIVGWTSSSSTVDQPPPPEIGYDQLVEQRRYTLGREDDTLTIHLGHFLNTGGSAISLSKQLSHFNVDETVTWNQSTTSVGQVIIGQTDGRNRFLLTCINPSGRNTVYSEQFMQNRIANDLSVAQAVRWFLGRSQFPDKRCLLGGLTISEDTERVDIARELELIWLEIQPQLAGVL
ncbi:MAG: hypothetical protein AAGB01_02145 [Cyanobacteria bacterium P01_F01_bin.42]